MTPSNFKVLIVLGKSGSGKGTQVEKLAEQYGLKIISSGSLLRARAEEKDFVGNRIAGILDKGGLIPTPIIFHLWLHELEKVTVAGDGGKGIIFEGSPRKLYEAYLLDETLWFYNLEKDMRVVHLDITDEEAARRLLERKREDDTEEAIRERLQWYKAEVVPAIEYYREKGRLVEINGEQSIEAVHQEIMEKLKDFLEQ
ncbi:MAG: nucleoside monophosphate kinase [Candidatus Wildermuthbacteria bacterium]|nr:nucleoside monophosphate kinase [Candidatus Wildermuthbacteria bacterium]